MDTKMFPLQAGYRDAKSAPHPLQIPWSVAEKAYCAYARRYGRGQSLERLAERGGFDGAEMDDLYPPWRDEVSELTTLRQRLAEAEAATLNIRDAMTAENLRVAADAARWEGAARIMAKEIKVHRWSVDPGHHEETDEAIRITDANPTAAALVAAKESSK